MIRRTRTRLALCAAVAVFLVSCGGSASSPTPSTDRPESSEPITDAATGPAPVVAVKVDEIRDAVKLVEQQLGGPQRYSEVNATQTEVNVFVVLGSGAESDYVVRNGVVEPPIGNATYTGSTFATSDLTFTPNVLDRVARGISDAELVAFSITPREGGGVDYIATLTAPSGEFRVLVAADGAVLATSAIDQTSGP